MIYGYLRVSSDDQDVNSQKQGVEAFAKAKGWQISEYISDEGVSGGKVPSKRDLGPLLKGLKKGDILICSEISRLGRDLYMVMDILHHCMKVGCVVYTVKDKFVLGDDIQSKVLAFAFGLAAEIERQMIRQRTREGLRLRMRMGVLLGRPFGNPAESVKLDSVKEEVLEQLRLGVPERRMAKNFGVDRSTIERTLHRWGVKKYDSVTRAIARERARRYKDERLKVVELPRSFVRDLILQNKTLPEIHMKLPQYDYEQVYDTFMADPEFNKLYRSHGMLRLTKGRKPPSSFQ